MKLKSTNKLSALIGASASHFTLHLSLFTLLFLLLPLTASAETLNVDGIEASGSGITYTSVTGTAALTVTGSSAAGAEGSYTGTDITLVSTLTATTTAVGDGNKAAVINNGGLLSLTGGTVSSARQGINLTGASSAVLDSVRVHISSTFAATTGIYLADSSTLTMTGGTVSSTSGSGSQSFGINLTGSSSAKIDGTLFYLNKGYSTTINVADGSTLLLTGGAVATDFNTMKGVVLTGTSSGTVSGVWFTGNGQGVVVENSSTLTLFGGTLTNGIVLSGSSNAKVDGSVFALNGNTAMGISATNSTLTLTDSVIRENGSIVNYANQRGVNLYGSSGTLKDVTITLSGSNNYGIYAAASSTLSLTDTEITASGSGVRGVYLDNSNGTLKDVNIVIDARAGVSVHAVNHSILSMDGGSILTSNSGYSTHGIYLSTSSGTFSGVTIEAGSYGANYGVDVINSSTLTLIDSNIIDTNFGSGDNMVYLDYRSTITASLNGNTLTGNILVTSTSTLTLTGSNGTVITGNVTSGSNTYGNSTVNITLSGSETKLIGKATHTADSAINLTIEDGTRLNQLTGNINTLTLQNGATLSSDDSNGALLLNGAAITVTTDLLTLSDGTILDYNDNALSLTGTLVIGNGIQIDFSDATLEDNQAYTILDWSNADLIGTVNIESFTAKNLASDMTGTFTVENNQLTFNATAIPEPSVYILLGIGLALLLLTARRRNVQS